MKVLIRINSQEKEKSTCSLHMFTQYLQEKWKYYCSFIAGNVCYENSGIDVEILQCLIKTAFIKFNIMP